MRNSVGARIRQLRKEKRLTQSEVGNLLGIKGSGYSLYEQNKRSLKAEMILNLCETYDVSSDYILGIVQEKHVSSELLQHKNYNDLSTVDMVEVCKGCSAAEAMDLLSRLKKILK